MTDEEQLTRETVLARIARDRAESEKLIAEVQKMGREGDKFAAEYHKLMREAEKYRAEEQKLWRDWRLTPWIFALTLAASLIGGLIARHL